jgi:CRP-like cAMP-binding protein
LRRLRQDRGRCSTGRPSAHAAAQGIASAAKRVAHFLAEIDTLYQQRHVSSATLSLNMSRAEIADNLGLTIETVSRAIGKLRNRNVTQGKR